MKKCCVRLLTMWMLIAGMVLSFNTAVYAGSSNIFPGVSNTYYIKGYCYRVHDMSRKRVNVYYNESCSSRNSREYVSVVTDECYIVGTSAGYNTVRITYPTSSGRKERWTSMGVFTSSGSYTIKYATAKIPTYKFASTRYGYGSISRNDQVRVYETHNGYVRVLYPVSGGYKIAWIRESDANRYLTGTSANQNNNNNSNNNSSDTLASPVPQGAKFSRKSNDSGWYGYHDINRGVSRGTPVYAIADGTITCRQAYKTFWGVKQLTSYGNYIEFTSDRGGYTAKYCHLNSFRNVGQVIPSYRTRRVSGSSGRYTLATRRVRKGEIIGYIGTTGNSSGVHLHFELRKNGVRINPTTVIGGLV